MVADDTTVRERVIHTSCVVCSVTIEVGEVRCLLRENVRDRLRVVDGIVGHFHGTDFSVCANGNMNLCPRPSFGMSMFVHFLLSFTEDFRLC